MNGKQMRQQVIKSGTSKMKIDSRGNNKGWHKFQSDSAYTMKYNARTGQTLIVVSSGLDKGTYV